MPYKDNLIGNIYGRLTVIAEAEQLPGKSASWLCRCECGNIVTVMGNNLRRGHTKSCGCLKSPDLTGKVFGKLTVLGRSDKRSPRGKRTVPLWECRCECGGITYKATDTLSNPEMSMCSDCAARYGAEAARNSAGFVDGTQLSKITDPKLTSSNSSGYRGVYYDKKSHRYVVRLIFKGKSMSFGSYLNIEDAVAVRKEAEKKYFGTFVEEYKRKIAAEPISEPVTDTIAVTESSDTAST